MAFHKAFLEVINYNYIVNTMQNLFKDDGTLVMDKLKIQYGIQNLLGFIII